MGRKNTTKVVVKGGKPALTEAKTKIKPVVSFDGVTDHHGRKYVYSPTAKLPYSRHSIYYPEGSAATNEDVPIQHGHEGGVGINGASPVLLMASAHTALTNSTSRLPYREIANAYLQMAVELLLAEEDFLKCLQSITDPEIRNSNEVLTLAAAHMLAVYENKSPVLRNTVSEVVQTAEAASVDLIAIPPKVAGNYRKIIDMVQKPVR